MGPGYGSFVFFGEDLLTIMQWAAGLLSEQKQMIVTGTTMDFVPCEYIRYWVSVFLFESALRASNKISKRSQLQFRLYSHDEQV